MTDKIINPALIAAMRVFADWAEPFQFDQSKPQPDWGYVHTDKDGVRTCWDLGKTLATVATLLEDNEIAHLKLEHLRELLGEERLNDMLNARVPRRG